MKCSNCLQIIPDDAAVFCPNCGTELYTKKAKNTNTMGKTKLDLNTEPDSFNLKGDELKLYQNLSYTVNELQEIPKTLQKNNLETEFKELRLGKLTNQYNELKTELKKHKGTNDSKKENEFNAIQSKFELLEKEIHELEMEISTLKEKKVSLLKLNNQFEKNKDDLEKLINQIMVNSNDSNSRKLIMERQNTINNITLQKETLDKKEQIYSSLDSIYSDLNIIYKDLKEYVEIIYNSYTRSSFIGVTLNRSKIQELVNDTRKKLSFVQKIDPPNNAIKTLEENLYLISYQNNDSLTFLESSLMQLKEQITKLDYEIDDAKKELDRLTTRLNENNEAILTSGKKTLEKTLEM